MWLVRHAGFGPAAPHWRPPVRWLTPPRPSLRAAPGVAASELARTSPTRGSRRMNPSRDPLPPLCAVGARSSRPVWSWCWASPTCARSAPTPPHPDPVGDHDWLEPGWGHGDAKRDHRCPRSRSGHSPSRTPRPCPAEVGRGVRRRRTLPSSWVRCARARPSRWSRPPRSTPASRPPRTRCSSSTPSWPVYDTAPAAAAAYDRIAEAIAALPTGSNSHGCTDRTRRPRPPAGGGRGRGALGCRWSRVRRRCNGCRSRPLRTPSSAPRSPWSSSRTPSSPSRLDQDSETTDAETLAAGSIAQAASIVRALLAAA